MWAFDIIFDNSGGLPKMSKIYVFDIFDNAGIDDWYSRIWKLLISSTIPTDYRKCQKSMVSISSTVPAKNHQNSQIYELSISSTIPADYWNCRTCRKMSEIHAFDMQMHFCHIGWNCRRYRMPTIPTFSADYRNSRKCMLSISSTILAGLQFLRNCRECQKPNILTFSADANSAVIVEALPGLSKISWFWICMIQSWYKSRQSSYKNRDCNSPLFFFIVIEILKFIYLHELLWYNYSNICSKYTSYIQMRPGLDMTCFKAWFDIHVCYDQFGCSNVNLKSYVKYVSIKALKPPKNTDYLQNCWKKHLKGLRANPVLL